MSVLFYGADVFFIVAVGEKFSVETGGRNVDRRMVANSEPVAGHKRPG